MDFQVISIFPEMFRAVTDYGITGRALERGQARLRLCNPRDFTVDRHRTVDARPYGGGPGMVMMAPPMIAAIESARGHAIPGSLVVHMSPQGQLLNHAVVRRFARLPGLILLAGRYEGIDERVLTEYVDEEWSIGDYVLSGGELAAMVLIDAVVRQLPGVVGNVESVGQDSFAHGLLDCAHYTRPEQFRGQSVPEVLLSGDHDAIRRWRLKQSLGRTWLRRPDLLQRIELTDEQNELLREFKRETAVQENSHG